MGSPNYHLAIAELTREARRQYALAHDNIVRVYGMVEGEDGLVWIVMELGVMSLNAFLASLRPPGSLPLATVLRLTRDVLAALVHLHGQDPRLVHYDLKPPNVVREGGGGGKGVGGGVPWGLCTHACVHVLKCECVRACICWCMPRRSARVHVSLCACVSASVRESMLYACGKFCTRACGPQCMYKSLAFPTVLCGRAAQLAGCPCAVVGPYFFASVLLWRQVLVVLPGGDIVAKLCDLGTTKSTTSFRRYGPDGGSAYYLPQGGEVVSPKCDMYSLAVMLAEVVLQHMEVCRGLAVVASVFVSSVPLCVCPSVFRCFPAASSFSPSLPLLPLPR